MSDTLCLAICTQGDFISADVLALLEARPAANSSSPAHGAAEHTNALTLSVYSRMAAANAAANAFPTPAFESGIPPALDLVSAAAAANRAAAGWAVYVRQLLEHGEVFKAVRVAREHSAVLATGEITGF